MKCTNCGNEIENGLKFCMECGTPIPQNKICPNCKMELPIAAKFCFGCGFNLNGKTDSKTKTSSTANLNMGDKNVIAGDVKGEEYNITGNATIIKNEDETKKVMTCHCCGKNIPIIEGFTCQTCGEFVCEDCFDPDKGVCKNCSQNASGSAENQYKEALKAVLLDGRVDIGERRSLNILQQSLGLSIQRAKEIEDEMRNGGSNSFSLTAIEEFNLNQALDLYYESGKLKEALNLIEPIFKKYPDEEKTISVYVPILAEVDSSKAIHLIKNLQADVLQAYLTYIDISLQENDMSLAESKIQQVKNLWGENVLSNYREILYLFKMYSTTQNEDFLGNAKYILQNFGECASQLERTLFFKAQVLIEHKQIDDDFIKSQNLYSFLSKKNPFKKGIDELKGSVDMLLINGSEFSMGKNETAHKVSVNSFYLAKTQITQSQFESVMNYNPSQASVLPNAPVDSVSWYEAVKFCNLLSEKDGLDSCYTLNGTSDTAKWGELPAEENETWKNIKCDFSVNGYRLPTEAEWEYAAKGGLEQKNFNYAGTNVLDDVGWYGVNSEKMTHAVSTKKTSPLGLYDMNGNVWEWCWDFFGEYSCEYDNPKGVSSGPGRVRRGGSWMNNADMCTVICRSSANPFKKFNINGFRIGKSDIE